MASRRQTRRRAKKRGKYKRTGEVLKAPKVKITRTDLPPKRRIIGKKRTPKERRKREFEIGKDLGHTRGEVRRGLAGKPMDRKRAREERRDIREEKGGFFSRFNLEKQTGEDIRMGVGPGITPAGPVITSTKTITSGLTRGKSFITRQVGGVVVERGKVGRALTTAMDKIPSGMRGVASRFASNTKSSALTTGFFLKLGLTIGAASLLKDAIGTYPFAGFLKEEAVQTVGFGFNVAKQAGDIEGMQAAVDMQREIVEQERNIIDKIPYANVQKQVKQFMKAAAVSLEIFQREIDNLKAGGESEFEQTRRESDEAARQRDLESRAIDAEYFRLIREGKFDEAQELLDEELKAAQSIVEGQPTPKTEPIKL